jgi:hypothetical protein
VLGKRADVTGDEGGRFDDHFPQGRSRNSESVDAKAWPERSQSSRSTVAFIFRYETSEYEEQGWSAPHVLGSSFADATLNISA